MSTKVIQKNITAKNVAARDIHQLTIQQPEKKTRLGELIKRLQTQLDKEPGAVEFVDRLKKWMHTRGISRNLEQKLSDAGKESLLISALEAKEQFAKQLYRTAFHPGLQEIYAEILGQIYSSFTYRIRPHISPDEPKGKTEAAIADLVDSICDQLAEAPPHLGIGHAEILGMLYYLTGNCYIDWD